jgi:GntR family transcriptional regulator, transcriptional repressor for pyruvate dehydrogenase complex
MSFRPATKKTLTSSVIEQIAGQIYSGELAPGESLPSERQLGDLLRVGRTTIREALRALETLRLVEVRPGQGIYVAGASSGQDGQLPLVGAALERQSRLHLAEARRIIEVEVAALAATRATKEQKDALCVLLREMQTAGREQRADDEALLHARFHTAIAEMGGNPVLSHVVAGIVRLLPATTLSHFIAGANERAEELHWAICDCIVRGDATEAREAMQAHMGHEERVIAQVFGARQPGMPLPAESEEKP